MRKLVIILIVTLCTVSACTKAPSSNSTNPVSASEAPDNSIGYPTVQAALTALKAKPEVKIKQQQGWTMIEDHESKDAYDLWSFVPQGNAAYPAAVKRTIYQKNNQIYIEMKVLCESTKSACDTLTNNFKALNDRIKTELLRHAKSN